MKPREVEVAADERGEGARRWSIEMGSVADPGCDGRVCWLSGSDGGVER